MLRRKTACSLEPISSVMSSSSELLTKVFEYLGIDDALVDKMLAQALDNLHLLLWGESGDGGLDDTADRGLVDGDETAG